MNLHTSYLSFLLHRQDFQKPNFTPKKTTKGIKNTKNVYMHFFSLNLEKFTPDRNFYTDMSVVSVRNMKYGSSQAYLAETVGAHI